MRRKSWKDLWHQPCRAKRPPNDITKVVAKLEIASEEIPKTFHECIVESHESTRQRLESSQSKNHEDHIAGKGFTSQVMIRFGTQVYSYAASDENSRCKSRSEQGMKKARDDTKMEIGKNQEQKGGFSGSTKSQKESPLCNIDGHMPPQECGVGTKISEVQRHKRAPW